MLETFADGKLLLVPSTAFNKIGVASMLHPQVISRRHFRPSLDA